MDRDILMMKQKGVTLIELSIGLAVLAVLLMSAICVSSGILINARAKQEQISLQAIAQACRNYQAMFGRWPVHLGDLVARELITPGVEQMQVTFNPQGQLLMINGGSGQGAVSMPWDGLASLDYVRKYETQQSDQPGVLLN